MKVVLCEDNEKLLDVLALYINNYVLMEDNSIEIVLKTTSPSEVITYIEYNRADCYFLDIDLNDKLTGLDLAKQIRMIDPVASIIFVTSHNEMLRLTFTYHVEALDFIVKDEIINLRSNVLKALETAYQKYIKIGLHPDMKYYPVKMGVFVKNIELNSIISFESSGLAHKVVLHTLHGTYEYYDSLNTIEEFDNDFFRIHRSYIINIKNIYRLDKKLKQVVMIDGNVFPVAFRRVKLLEKEIMGVIG